MKNVMYITMCTGPEGGMLPNVGIKVLHSLIGGV